ncbi:Type I transmembrane sorting receptor [Ascosphaera aggregata]|nr:Type I transmembrane sorting receptor [Ascosphaera aggregata]
MPSITAYASALLLFSSYFAEASPARNGKRSFSITETPFRRSITPERGLFWRRNQKGTLLHRADSNSTGKETSARAMNIRHDTEYLFPVTVGETTFNLQLDTGSSDLWIYGEDNQYIGKHSRYKPSKNGNKIANSSWEISYADGSGAYGHVWRDTVSIGSISVEEQGVETASFVTSQLVRDANSDGIIGLGFSVGNHASPRQMTFFENVVDRLEEPLFTADLKHDAPGTYDFGFVDDEKYTGDITYVDVDSSRGYWEFTVDDLSLGNRSIATKLGSIADTGTTLLVLNDDIAQEYFKDVKNLTEVNGRWIVNCNARLADLTFTIGGHKIFVPGNTGIPVIDGNCYTPIAVSQVSAVRKNAAISAAAQMESAMIKSGMSVSALGGTAGIVRCRACAREAVFSDSRADIWEDGSGKKFFGGDDVTVVAVPEVLKYLDIELAAMGVKMQFKVKN